MASQKMRVRQRGRESVREKERGGERERERERVKEQASHTAAAAADECGSDRKKTEAAHILSSPPAAHEHMWADKLTLQPALTLCLPGAAERRGRVGEEEEVVGK